ncbi:helix-turn-helix domain-containing protein [Nocardioides sp. GY 10113]|uniref:helix-turn-helix domain-containing protein n=1 Tax=Nocardioides sp. GY 10113 TaxID=2569761 RepID=UPI0010A85A2F|nr:helix-turn-helix domain-containing protein [Nocardioides sp. GY 10113]TIC86704.1 helix-turn-helix domain-containing protein [Nocardioides sp. GY 10113]
MAASPKTGDLELGRAIAARREELGMSRKELAQATGLSYPYIAQIETGYRLPSTKHQVALSRTLGLSLDELFGTAEAHPDIPPSTSSPRQRPTLEQAVDGAARQIESLPTSVRLEALSRLQLRIMQGVTDERARRHR